MDRLLFVTGKLAHDALAGVLAQMNPEFSYDIATLKITVAALMTTRWIAAHLDLPDAHGYDRIIIPGLCEGDPALISARWGAPAEKGPDDLKDLPAFFGRQEADEYGGYDVRIFAEINHVPSLSTDEILNVAAYYRDSGADVIDLGGSLDRPFTAVAEVVRALKEGGFATSIDTFNAEEILAADAAGVDYLLSINGSNMHLAPRLRCTPVVIPDFGQGLESLYANMAALDRAGITNYIVDPIVEPLIVGFVPSLLRYAEVRRRFPTVPMLMGIGNLTELTDADTTGTNALLLGICQELGVDNVLTTEVAHWARGSVREVACARQLMAYAGRHRRVPKNLDDRLITLKDRRLRPYTEPELREMQRGISDPNYRIFADERQIYVFNAERFVVGVEIQEIFDQLEVDEASHAFYLGKELMKAYTAITLGKVYRQEQPLQWGYLTREEPSAHGRRVRLTQRSARRQSPRNG
jgi:dihydropteroate synthase-like protein